MPSSTKIPLGTLGDINVGYQLRQAVEIEPQGEHPLIQLGNVQDGYIEMKNLNRMTLKGKLDKAGRPLSAVRTYHYVHTGDILLRSRGATYGSAKVVEESDKAIALSPLFILRLQSPLVVDDYLVWFINRSETQAVLRSKQGGSYIPSVSLESFKELEIILPPRKVQEQIVEIDQLARHEYELTQRLQKARDTFITASLEKLLNS